MSYPVPVRVLAFHPPIACSGYPAPRSLVSQVVKGLFAKLAGAAIDHNFFIRNKVAVKPGPPVYQLERPGRADGKGPQAGAGAKLRMMNVQRDRSRVVNQIGLLTGQLAAPIAF